MSPNFKNFLRTKLKSTAFNGEDSSENDMLRNSFSGKLNVNEEYLQAFRTKSYLQMFNEVQKHQETTSAAAAATHLPECLLEPPQEFVNGVKIHRLLILYFEASVEAYRSCQLLLESLRQTRTNHRKIRRVITLTAHGGDHDGDGDGDGDGNHFSGIIFRELSSFSHLKTPFSITSPVQFSVLHETHLELLQKLSKKVKKIQRKLKLRRILKKVAGVCFVLSNAAVLVSLLILAFHSLIGVVAAPGLVGCFVSLLQKRSDRKLTTAMSPEVVFRQMDVAAKGLYIMMNDFDTLSRMVARLDGEIEQVKAIAGICMRSRRCEILKEAAKEFVVEDDSIVEQMEEVEQHIYLCFLTINRSRRLVMEEITGSGQKKSD